jgi:uncharacterized protein (DUF983 family)
LLNSLPPAILLDISIFFTALAWAIGFYIVDKRPYIFASLAIGCFVCLFGYSVFSLNAPVWAVVPSLLPLDIFLSWYVLKKPRKIAIAYVSTWVFYTVFHVALSGLLRFDLLIPGWKLHA